MDILCAHMDPVRIRLATRPARDAKDGRRGSRSVAFMMPASFADAFGGLGAGTAFPSAGACLPKLRAAAPAVAGCLSLGLGPCNRPGLIAVLSSFLGGGIKYHIGRGVHCFRGCCALFGFQRGSRAIFAWHVELRCPTRPRRRHRALLGAGACCFCGPVAAPGDAGLPLFEVLSALRRATPLSCVDARFSHARGAVDYKRARLSVAGLPRGPFRQQSAPTPPLHPARLATKSRALRALETRRGALRMGVRARLPPISRGRLRACEPFPQFLVAFRRVHSVSPTSREKRRMMSVANALPLCGALAFPVSSAGIAAPSDF
ncbi:hypothetical protein, conserved in T. vivax [Trypanosoma vivax Y486]|uniref:Uncharacterized protein n=1 Tax=Trypanosoma vivax (strain Y486) TaxID=1055687 RepID=F9WNG7_TRYVY|nr:hypothetical protein, conserved in T. vivax [Trypanosoma vivax Y486]|eukprot:CCD19085.1 hypothetical protein, conserved in T. vivax [Trypanosoma vivax Y486]